MTDPIADMLTRIRNAIAVHQSTVTIPRSNIKEAIAKTLQEEGYIKSYQIEQTSTNQPNIVITLKYSGKDPVITELTRISKPGRRTYVKSKNIKPILSGHGITIVSTSQGVMTGSKARKAKLGGEILCSIW